MYDPLKKLGLKHLQAYYYASAVAAKKVAEVPGNDALLVAVKDYVEGIATGTIRAGRAEDIRRIKDIPYDATITPQRRLFLISEALSKVFPEFHNERQ